MHDVDGKEGENAAAGRTEVLNTGRAPLARTRPGALTSTTVRRDQPTCPAAGEHDAAVDRGEERGTVFLEVTALSHGPDGVARHQGGVVFVPGVAPGDHVHARLVDARSTFARAQVVDCTPGPAHRDPPCPWVDACGGCPWQQVVYPEQLAAKAANVRETLARIGGVTAARELPIRAAPDEWRYRRRIRLHVGRNGALGYRQPRSHRLVEIDDCVIAEASLSEALPVVRRIATHLRTRLRTLEILVNGRSAVVIRGVADGTFVATDAEVLTDLLAASVTIAGIEIAGRDWERSFGDIRIVVHPDDGTTIVQRPGTFSQVNTQANRLLVDTVRTLATPAARILDLFCGAGNLSLPLAGAGADVLGVDASAMAIADARASAADGGVERVRFEALPALRFLCQQGLAGADLVLLDPPRAGAAAEVVQLARLRPPRILYVSCDPATLARDAKILVAAGYVVDRVQPLDLFPQTPHVETVLEACCY